LDFVFLIPAIFHPPGVALARQIRSLRYYHEAGMAVCYRPIDEVSGWDLIIQDPGVATSIDADLYRSPVIDSALSGHIPWRV